MVFPFGSLFVACEPIGFCFRERFVCGKINLGLGVASVNFPGVGLDHVFEILWIVCIPCILETFSMKYMNECIGNCIYGGGSPV